MHPASAQVVRATIARAMLEGAPLVADRVGAIVLRPHQREAVSRLRAMIERHGGAMLADRVGAGKTYVATALAAYLGGETLVVAPAVLREMWSGALAVSGLDAQIVTHETLSRGVSVGGPFAFIIVDEAHRFRSPSAKRYAALARLCRTSRMLLLSATPVQNTRADLAAQLALFVGRRAWLMSEEELASYVVRGSEAPAGLPRLDGPHLVSLPEADDWLDAILALPPPLPARDEGLAATLLAFGLMHQWSSSRAALLGALQRRRARAIALDAALEQGRSPTRAELSAWACDAEAVQLAFPELVAAAEPASADLQTMRATLARHRAAVERLIHELRAAPDADQERAGALRDIRARHPGERILVFCHYAETATSLGKLLMNDGGVATLTGARGAHIASGRVSRAEVLAQFAPETDVRTTAAARIEMLIATDLLSEGVNLQGASVVVHLDLPWNPARMEQRVGRAHRLGSRHARVTVYAFAPPAPSERLLAIEQRLAAKLRDAERTVGVAGCILPSISSMLSRAASPAEAQSELHVSLGAWRAESDANVHTNAPCVAAVTSERSGALACIVSGESPMLVGIVGGRVTTEQRVLRDLVRIANGREAAIDDRALQQNVAQLESWLETQRGAAAVDLPAASAARARRLALARVTQALARAPRHRRSQMAPLAAAARAVATAQLGEGAERILETIVASALPDEAWLRSIAAFGELNARTAYTTDGGARAASGRVLAMLMLVPAAAPRL